MQQSFRALFADLLEHPSLTADRLGSWLVSQTGLSCLLAPNPSNPTRCSAPLRPARRCLLCRCILCPTCFLSSRHNDHPSEPVAVDGVCDCGDGLRNAGDGCAEHSGVLPLASPLPSLAAARPAFGAVLGELLDLLPHHREYASVLVELFRLAAALSRDVAVVAMLAALFDEASFLRVCRAYAALLPEHPPFASSFAAVLHALLRHPDASHLAVVALSVPAPLFRQPFLCSPLSPPTCPQTLLALLNTLHQQLRAHLSAPALARLSLIPVRAAHAAFAANIRLVASAAPAFTPDAVDRLASLLTALAFVLAQDSTHLPDSSVAYLLKALARVALRAVWQLAASIDLGLLARLLASLTKETPPSAFAADCVGLLLFETKARGGSAAPIRACLAPYFPAARRRLVRYPLHPFDFTSDSCPVPFRLAQNPTAPPLDASLHAPLATLTNHSVRVGRLCGAYALLAEHLKADGHAVFVREMAPLCDEAAAHEYLLRVLQANTSPAFLRSVVDIYRASTTPLRSLRGEACCAVLGTSLEPSLCVSPFHPFALILRGDAVSRLHATYLAVCGANRYPLLCGVSVKGWRREIAAQQDLLVNIASLSARNVTLVPAVVFLLWLRVCSACTVPQHPANKVAARLLRTWQAASPVCARTAWRLAAEYAVVDTTLPAEFYALCN